MRRILPACLAIILSSTAWADDLKEYRTVDKAITTRISKAAPVERPTTKKPGYLGAHVEATKAGLLKVIGVAFDSPAEKGGLKAGDLIQSINAKKLDSPEAMRVMLHALTPGAEIKVLLSRGKKSETKSIKLGAISLPMTGGSSASSRPVLGINVGNSRTGVLVSAVTRGSGAANGGLRAGDLIIKIDTSAMQNINSLRAVLARKKPGDVVNVTFKRGKETKTTKVKLGAPFDPRRAGRGWNTRARRGVWTKPVYRLAVVCVEFSDVKHNKKITSKEWEKALFSTGKYTGKSVTGQPIYGSLNDYYQEISYKKFNVTGKVFDYVQVAKKRSAYSASGVSRSTLLIEALDKLLARDGKDALNEFDGIFFMYAGARARVARGGLYWPHRASFTYKRKRWAYFICPEGGSRMDSISVIAHEFGHMLGMPDLYARQGSRPEGLGVWCTMSTGHGRRGRPLHFSAWCKEQLGWLKPAVIDPRTKQKLILSPVGSTNNQCCKVLIRPDGSE